MMMFQDLQPELLDASYSSRNRSRRNLTSHMPYAA